ncbi:unnamed protein product [Amoebophrya sp. A25]|nr:unnamed protein product [Amoebophrya sp. A25]|eukprot:GSA25T00010256001.1
MTTVRLRLENKQITIKKMSITSHVPPSRTTSATALEQQRMITFLENHGVVFSELLQDVLAKKPENPSLFILQRLCEEATQDELDRAGLALLHRKTASNQLCARALLADILSDIGKRRTESAPRPEQEDVEEELAASREDGEHDEIQEDYDIEDGDEIEDGQF